MAELSGLLWWNFAYTLILTRCSPRDCQSHLGLAEALPRFKFWKKQWNWPYLLKRFKYFDKIMHKHCYWRELDRGIAKCHLSSLEAMPRSRSKKQVNLTLSAFGTFWYASVQILKKVKLKRTLHIFICKKKKKKKKVQTHLDIIFLCVT